MLALLVFGIAFLYIIILWLGSFIQAIEEFISSFSRKKPTNNSVKTTTYIYTTETRSQTPKKKVSKTNQPKRKKSKKKCYVYLMKDTCNEYYKIGMSNDPYYREKTLQSEKPTIKTLGFKKYDDRELAGKIEKNLHQKYHKKRIRGEWFNLSPEEVKSILDSFSNKKEFNSKEYTKNSKINQTDLSNNIKLNKVIERMLITKELYFEAKNSHNHKMTQIYLQDLKRLTQEKKQLQGGTLRNRKIRKEIFDSHN